MSIITKNLLYIVVILFFVVCDALLLTDEFINDMLEALKTNQMNLTNIIHKCDNHLMEIPTQEEDDDSIPPKEDVSELNLDNTISPSLNTNITFFQNTSTSFNDTYTLNSTYISPNTTLKVATHKQCSVYDSEFDSVLHSSYSSPSLISSFIPSLSSLQPSSPLRHLLNSPMNSPFSTTTLPASPPPFTSPYCALLTDLLTRQICWSPPQSSINPQDIVTPTPNFTSPPPSLKSSNKSYTNTNLPLNYVNSQSFSKPSLPTLIQSSLRLLKNRKPNPKLNSLRSETKKPLHQNSTHMLQSNTNKTDKLHNDTFSKTDSNMNNTIPLHSSDPLKEIKYLKAKHLIRLARENASVLNDVVRVLRDVVGVYSKWSFKSIDKIVEKSGRKSIISSKPWFDVEHVRDAMRFKARLHSFNDLHAIVNALLLHDIEVVEVDLEKFTTPKIYGWRPICIDLRFPNGLLVEFYAVVADMDLKITKHPNHLLYENWRLVDVEALPGYSLVTEIINSPDSHILLQPWSQSKSCSLSESSPTETSTKLQNLSKSLKSEKHSDVCSKDTYLKEVWLYYNNAFSSNYRYTTAMWRWESRTNSEEKNEKYHNVNSDPKHIAFSNKLFGHFWTSTNKIMSNNRYCDDAINYITSQKGTDKHTRLEHSIIAWILEQGFKLPINKKYN